MSASVAQIEDAPVFETTGRRRKRVPKYDMAPIEIDVRRRAIQAC